MKSDDKARKKNEKRATRWQRKGVRKSAIVVHEKKLLGGVERERKLSSRNVNVRRECNMFCPTNRNRDEMSNVFKI